MKQLYSILFFLLMIVPPAPAGTIALIIDDIGYNYSAGMKAARSR